MSADLPSPLVPAEVDLRDFPFTPMYRARLFGSAFHARASDAEWRAGVTLWLKSQDQVPAGSLPGDDVELCRLAELGRDSRTWNKIRARALHGWTACSDGRLYHAVTAEVVLEAWIEKLLQRKSSGAGNAKRWGGEFDSGSVEEAIAVAADILRTLNPESRTLRKMVPRKKTGSPTGNPDGVPPGSQETGKRQGREDYKKPDAVAPGNVFDLQAKPAKPRKSKTPVDPGIAVEFELWYAEFPLKRSPEQALAAFAKARKKVDLQTLIRGAIRYRDDPKRKPDYTKYPATWLNAGCWRDDVGADLLGGADNDRGDITARDAIAYRNVL